MGRLSDLLQPPTSGGIIDTTGNGYSTTTNYESSNKEVQSRSKFFNEEYDYTTSLGNVSGNNALIDASTGLPDWGKISPRSKAAEGGGFFMETANFAGNMLGGFVDSALFGLPGLIDDLTGLRDVSPWLSLREWTSLGAYDTWEEESTAGKWGKSIGVGIGMIVPFKWVGAGLNAGVKMGMRAKPAGSLFKSLTKSSRQGFTSKYVGQEGADKLIAGISRVGGARTGQAMDASTDAFKTGYDALFQDAFNLVNSSTYKKMFKKGGAMLQQATEEMTQSILQTVPKLSTKEAGSLAQALINEAGKQSAGSMHHFTEWMVTKTPLLKHLANNTYAKQTMAAYTSDFVVGATMFTAEYALHNTALAIAGGVSDKSMKDLAKQIDPRSKAAHTTHIEGGFLPVLGEIFKSGAWMGLLGPSRFVKGGSTVGGKGYKEAIKEGFKTITKSYKPVRRMSGDYARMTLNMIDEAADGLLANKIDDLAVTAINSLSDDAARAMVKQVRKQFAKDYGVFMIKEFGKDVNVFSDIAGIYAGKGFQSSVPRMIAGTLMMNAPNLYDQMMKDPKNFYQAFGQDGHEIAQNILIGMVFSRSGRTFNTGSKARYFESGEMREYYANNINDINKMKFGLDLIGAPVDNGLKIAGNVYSATSQKVRNQPLFKEIDGVVGDKYVDRTDPNAPSLNRKEAGRAFFDYLKEQGVKPGTPEFRIEVEKWENFKKIMEVYDSTAPEINKMFRTVDGKEAYEAVQQLNSIPEIANAKDITLVMDNALTQAMIQANKPYKNLRKEFIVNSFKAMGISIGKDGSGNLVIPEIDLGNFGRSNRQSGYVRQTELNSAKYVLTEMIAQGVKDGWILKKGSRQATDTPQNLTEFVDSFGNSKEAMVIHTYGSESAKSGAFPRGGKEASERLLISDSMREASLSIDQMEQTRNLLTLFSDNKYSPAEIFHTLPEGRREVILDLMQQIGLDKNATLDISNVDPSKHQDAIEFFSRVKSLHKLMNPKGSSQKVDVTMSQVEGLRDAIFEITGDALMKESVFKSVEAEAFNYFLNRIKVSESSSPYSTGVAVHHLLNGNRKLNSTGDFNNRLGNFVIRTSEGLVFADAKSLVARIKALSPDKEALIDKEGLGDFYSGLQSVLEQSGDIISFTRNTKDIDLIIKTMGPDAIIDLLTQTKSISNTGAMKEMVTKTLPLEQAQMNINETLNSLVDLNIVKVAKDDVIYENLSQLHQSTGQLVKLLQFAMQNKDFAMLANLTKSKIEFDNFFRELEVFNNIDPMKEGGIDAAWTKKLTEQIILAQNFLNKNYGTLDGQNYSKWVTEKINENHRNLPLDYKHDEMLVNITPTQFEGRYGLSVSTVKTIVEPFKINYNKSQDIKQIDKAYDAIIKAVEVEQQKVTDPKLKKSKSDIQIDVLQTVLTTFGTKELNKVRFVANGDGSGRFVLDKTYMPNQKNNGVLAVADYLGLGDMFYVLDKQMYFIGTDGKTIKKTMTPNANELNVFKSAIENPIGIDNPRARIDMKKQVVGNTFNVNVKPENYIYVPFDESIQIVVPRQHAKDSALRAYQDGGKLSNRLTAILKDVDPRRLADILKVFRDPGKMNDPATLESALLTARLAVDAPHLLIDNVKDIVTLADAWKRLKLPEFSKGRVYTPEMLEYMDSWYKKHLPDNPHFKDVVDSYDHFRTPSGWRKMKFLSLGDESKDSYFNSEIRLESWMNDQEAIWKASGSGELWTASERSAIIAQHQAAAKSVVDAPTYLKKESFIIHLAQLGIRSDWLITNSKGDIVGFKSGAMKPKGVNVQVDEQTGMVQVWYDKTAFFYDAKMDGLMRKAGVDGISFASGNKINKYRENSTEKLRDRYVETDKGPDRISETIFGDIEKVVNLNQSRTDLVIELPLSTFNVTNVSREHSAKAGANMAVHHSDSRQLAPWMNLGDKINEFQFFLTKAQSNEYALTSVARELMGIKSDQGDLMLSKVPVEEILGQNGMILDSWMGDVVADKLFTYFFQGSKIATGDVGNSSITPMAPPIHMNNNYKDLAIRRYEKVIDGEGRERSVGRQVVIGDYTPDSFHLNKQFSFLGSRNTSYRGGDVRNPNESGFFVTRLTIQVNGESKTGDFSIIPTEVGKNGHIKKFSLIGMGYELSAKEIVDLNVKGNGVDSRVFNDNNTTTYNDIIARATKVYNEMVDLQANTGGNKGLTNLDVVKYLAKAEPLIKAGILTNRQPRNLVNDIVVNKISADAVSRTIPNVKNVKITSYKAGVDAKEGNKSEQNFIDAIETQDSDYDYDKSSGYMSAPSDFYKTVAKKAGYGNRNDSYSFAETFFAQLNLQLDSGSEMARHLQIVNNASAVRGRIVKLHNIVSYFKNAFGNDPVMGKYSVDNVAYEIRMKPDADYFLVADNIANWAKIFIDNYKKPTDLMNIESIVQDILFGTDKARNNGTRHYEGLFEVVQTTNNKDPKKPRVIPFIDGQFKEIRPIIYQKMVKPISKYLRYNRGLTENQQGDSQSLKLKDLANGFETLQKELDNPFIYDTNWKFSIGNKSDYSINLRNGMQTLSDYIIGGWGDVAHAGASQNPFDIAMRSLTQVYNKSITKNGSVKKFTEVQNIMNQAEAGIFLESQGIKNFDRSTVSEALWKHVKNDFDFIETTRLTYRIDALNKDLKFLKMNKHSDDTEIKTLQNKIVEMESIKSDIELRLGGQYEYEAGKPTFKLGYQKEKTYRANSDMVFWDTKGNMMLTIEKGNYNSIDIKSDWIAIVNPRRFALVNPEKQANLQSKLTAFGSMATDINPTNKVVDFMGAKEYRDVVIPVLARLGDLLKMEKQRFAKGEIDGVELSVNRKALLNEALNSPTVTTPLQRKAIIWEFFRPGNDMSKVAYYKTNEGKNINSIYLYENPMNKATWGLLMDIINQEAFSLTNNMSKAEAKSLATEIVQRQTLASIGISNPHIDVRLDYNFGKYNQRKNRNLYIELNQKGLEKLTINPEGERALGILNDFVHGETLLTPFQVGRLEVLVDRNSTDIFLSNSNAKDHIPARPKRNFGTPKDETPLLYIRALNETKRRNRKTNRCSK